MNDRKEKMILIISAIRKRLNYEKLIHKTATYGKDTIGYYDADNDYFDLSYDGIAVCITGQIVKPLDRDFDIDMWLDKLLAIISQKIAIFDGKEYILTETI